MDPNLDEQTRRDLEQALQLKIYPGTEVMVDVHNHLFVKSSSGDHTVLVPQPSDSANDPLVGRSIQFVDDCANSPRIGALPGNPVPYFPLCWCLSRKV